MAHPRAKLNLFGRELLVRRWTVAMATRAQGVSRATGYRWIGRFRGEGRVGLVHRSSRPHRSPAATPAPEVDRIVAARDTWHWGSDRLGLLLGHPPSTVAAVLRRAGAPRLADIDRPTGLPVQRYEVCHPGALLHRALCSLLELAAAFRLAKYLLTERCATEVAVVIDCRYPRTVFIR